MRHMLSSGVTALQNISTPPLIAYRSWISEIGVSSTTGWRWIKNGWIHPINIAGRLYVTGEEIENFRLRANAGEFARPATGAAAAHGDASAADEDDEPSSAGSIPMPVPRIEKDGADRPATSVA